MTRIELHPAYCWDCDACGRQNFLRAVNRDATPEEMLRQSGILIDAGIIEPEMDEVLEGVQFQQTPRDVTCEHCGTRFIVDKFGDSNDQ